MEKLNEVQQNKKILNEVEISKIQDPKMRQIRQKYWNLRHRAFLDEYHISDQELEKVWNKLCEEEQAEIEEYMRVSKEGGEI